MGHFCPSQAPVSVDEFVLVAVRLLTATRIETQHRHAIRVLSREEPRGAEF